ncbi:PD-(D/E)XK nuclease family protein [Candidatus Woesebacteria bacterium]|nr:PD-(D/E)XK nuclease family protein [Candidatus Woesebacteria bacterium]
MSDYYNPTRGADWNYGGKNWKLSRSKIDLFLECPRCFYLDNKLGLKRVPGFPFSINSAVDYLLKQEFDAHRVRGEQHPLQKEYGIDARPVAHDELDLWRHNFTGVQHLHQPTGMLVSGAIDDLWISGAGEYIVVDYKATAKDEAVTELDKDWQDGYKRQMEVYQWLIRQNGLPVSSTGYFVYCTGKMDRTAFDKRIEFDVNLIPYTGDDSWVEGTLGEIKECLDTDLIPDTGTTCDHCAYWNARNRFEE